MGRFWQIVRIIDKNVNFTHLSSHVSKHYSNPYKISHWCMALAVTFYWPDYMINQNKYTIS